MRLLTYVVLIVVGVGFVGFVMTNLDSRVDITIGSTVHSGVPAWVVVAVSLVVGFFFTALIAIVEGARTRIENRRIKREIRKMETEIHYLRTLPRSQPKAEPDALAAPEPPDTVPIAPATDATSHVPMAPVYGMDDEEIPPDPDDDIYSGGRAV